jgi:ABC-2 type transport system ATP-binding protein
MPHVIEVHDLEQRYGKTTVLRQIDLNVDKGETLALIGPSGAGKTTLVSVIMGMLKPSQGTVRVLDSSMPNRKLLSHIGFMAQTDALYQTLSARKNLQFFASLQELTTREFDKNIGHVAEVVNLTAYLDKPVSSFSGGMKRRLSLAIALISDPDLLILDEPTVGIDPELRIHIWSELKELAQAGKTILLTTHVMEDAEQAGSVLMIREGRAIAYGTPESLKTQYAVESVEEVFLIAGRQQDQASGTEEEASGEAHVSGAAQKGKAVR